ncbi:MAG: hypothetical protein Kow0080_36280 [Candidatus Promineifilaceae bacterium]
MKKIITFLGIYPKETQYEFQGQTYTGQVFAEAMYQFLDFDEMLVFTTEDAEKNTLPILTALVDDRIKSVSIPDGKDAQEMWQIFDELTNVVEDGDSVIFDITHGLRSLPFLVFLAAAFLKSAKNVNIEAIYYGAFELSKQNDGKAPVIEMSQFVSLLDWLNASDQFIQTGNAAGLVEQIRAARPAWQPQSDKATHEKSRQIRQAADSLESVSRALRLILPDQAMGEIEKLQATLNSASASVEEYAPPFSVLAQKVLSAYMPLALPNPRAPENIVASLNREKELICWYLDHKQIVQAVAIAREWLVSWGVVHAGYIDLYNKSIRKEIEEAFGRANDQKKKQRGSFEDFSFSSGVHLRDLPDVNKTLKLYEQLGDMRNTLLHAGKRPSSDPAETLERNICCLCRQLVTLPLPESH